MKYFGLFAALVLVSIFGGCELRVNNIQNTYYGSSLENVIVADRIVDRFGNTYPATCQGDVRFYGYFEQCNSDPYNDALLESEPVVADLYCTFYDAFNRESGYWYSSRHPQGAYFERGYITQVCSGTGAPLNLRYLDPKMAPVLVDQELPKNVSLAEIEKKYFPNGLERKRMEKPVVIKTYKEFVSEGKINGSIK